VSHRTVIVPESFPGLLEVASDNVGELTLEQLRTASFAKILETL